MMTSLPNAHWRLGDCILELLELVHLYNRIIYHIDTVNWMAPIVFNMEEKVMTTSLFYFILATKEAHPVNSVHG